MSEPQGLSIPEQFLSLVLAEIRARGGISPAEYLPHALNVAHRIPYHVSVEEVVAMFLHWIYKEPIPDSDRELWNRISPDGDERAGSS